MEGEQCGDNLDGYSTVHIAVLHLFHGHIPPTQQLATDTQQLTIDLKQESADPRADR